MNGSRRAGGHTRADVGVHNIVEAVRGPRSVIVPRVGTHALVHLISLLSMSESQ